MINKLSNAQLVAEYQKTKKLFIQAKEGTEEEKIIDMKLTVLFLEMDKRNIDLREYIC